jgi:hypothetical protein
LIYKEHKRGFLLNGRFSDLAETILVEEGAPNRGFLEQGEAREQEGVVWDENYGSAISLPQP